MADDPGQIVDAEWGGGLGELGQEPSGGVDELVVDLVDRLTSTLMRGLYLTGLSALYRELVMAVVARLPMLAR